MNKNAIKKFAIEARKKLIDSVTDKAGMLGITEKSCSEPVTRGTDFEVYQTIAGTEVTLNRRQCEQRRRLVSQIESRGFEAVVEEVAYTWFNRICAIRFMEVNDYLPNRVRVLSSEKEGKMEPDIVTQAPDVDLDLTAQEKEEIINWKMSGTSEDTDKLYCKLFLKQCHQLHDILPGLFVADSDYMELLFGISYTNKDDVIYMLVNPETGIPEADFNVTTLDEEGNPTGQVEIIGWLYQYYNTELNNQVYDGNMSKSRIAKELLPAATTIYTPDWVIRYMIENSVGRIWIEHLRAVDPNTDEKATAARFGWKYYLPEAEQEESVNVKLAEIRTTYKDLKPTDITCIDPCMGSGHILIAMFDVLMDIYESTGYDKREAAFEIVEHNIHGLDIDQRAYQLAYFAVMMKGRGYNRRFLHRREGKWEPKIYAIVESNEINRNHLQFFGAHLSERERNLAIMQMEGLLNTFKDAKEYGSILNVNMCDWDMLKKFVDDLSTIGQISFESVGSEETQESLRKLISVARNLGKKYDVVVTNPPYLGNSRFSNKLNKYVTDNYSIVKNDLSMVVFKKVMDDLIQHNGYVSFITTSSWMYLSRFENFRHEILDKATFTSIVDFGTELFDGKVGHNPISSWVCRNAEYNNNIVAIRLVEYCFSDRYLKQKNFFEHQNYYYIKQKEFSKIPGVPFSYWLSNKAIDVFEKNRKFEDFGTTRAGMITGNNDKFIRLWTEVDFSKIGIGMENRDIAKKSKKKWFPYNKGGEYRKWYGNNIFVVNWENDGNYMRNYKDEKGKIPAHAFNLDYIFKKNITWNAISFYKFSARFSDYGFLYDASGSFADIDNNNLYYMLGFLCSNVTDYYLSAMNPTMNFQKGNVSSLPIIIDESRRSEIEMLVKQNILLSKEDWDSAETSWDFQKHPLVSKKYMTIENAMYDWKMKCETRRNTLRQNEEQLNKIFIDMYDLGGEIVPDVKEKDIVLHKVDENEEIKSFISYVVGCLLGRYSLSTPGIINRKDMDYCNRLSKNIIIPITDEEYFEDDIVILFCDWLKKAYGESKLEENLKYIAEHLKYKMNNPKETIRAYFLNDFEKDHCSKYSALGSGKRPIYWLFDSGKQNGFKALIYMHHYDADTVGRVRTDYLHRAQKYVETAMQSAQYTIDNASSTSEKSKATKAVTKYTKQLTEMKIYDEAIAHIANKRIEIDLDDGVKVNYEKFQGVEVAQEGKKALKVDLLAKLK